MNKDLTITRLYDIYGKLLTEKQKEVFTLYYFDDTSLSEIASMLGKSRQSVRESIKSAETQLKNYENKLNFLNKIDKIESLSEIDKKAVEIILNILEE